MTAPAAPRPASDPTAPDLAGGGGDVWDAAAQRDAAYARHVDLARCPRCDAETAGRRACAACGLALTDGVVADAVTRGAARARRQLVVLGLLASNAVTGVLALSFGHGIGRRSVAVAAAREDRASALDARRVFGGARVDAAYEIHAADLRELFSPEFVPGPCAMRTAQGAVERTAGPCVVFTPPPAAPGRPADPRARDVALVMAHANGWKGLSGEDRQVMLVALAQNHQRFLAAVGAADTVHFQVRIAVANGTAGGATVGLRGRDGALAYK